MRTLEGLTVVTFEHAIAAPFCTRQLADLGARVIKVERPGAGDFARGYDKRTRGLASHFVWVNRSKESVTLDIKHPQGKDVMQALIASADVVVQNLAPGAAARLGIDWATLSAKHPRLILCDISGYGPDGPYRDKKAYDLLIQSEAGLVSITGTEQEPAKSGASVADIAAGMYAYSNILAALLRRGVTGKGSHIEVSMLEAMTEWTSYALYYTYDGAAPPVRAGASHAAIFPYGPFTAGDGVTVILAVQNEREWESFCRTVLKRPDVMTNAAYAGNLQRVGKRDELKQLVDGVFQGLTGEQLVERLDEAGIANARMNDMQGVWEHPQLKARDRWTEIDSPVGKLRALFPPGMNREDDPRMDPVPALGEHTDAVLAELGFAAGDVAALRTAGAI
ncbi:CaiB/BaiF CoA-transferase family protein [Caenimonas sp. SL110]|uniref:CaiB/BaiF CoA transferase family protein n=1 Tax=Caenimonas sp. SL110 TaxID=1450524 RepID=UPI000652F6E6|nr:CaiB/BaiF CoA-transferase family protein [Caenimonas sp. SL110]